MIENINLTDKDFRSITIVKNKHQYRAKHNTTGISSLDNLSTIKATMYSWSKFKDYEINEYTDVDNDDFDIDKELDMSEDIVFGWYICEGKYIYDIESNCDVFY